MALLLKSKPTSLPSGRKVGVGRKTSLPKKSESEQEDSWKQGAFPFGIWIMRKSEAVGMSPEAGRLEELGYKLVSDWARFGTVLKYRKGDDWRIVFLQRPNQSFTVRESLIFLRDHWKFRRKEDEEWLQKLLCKP